MTSSPASRPGQELREHVRRDVLISGHIQCCGEKQPCEVVNLSAGGARVRTFASYAPGQELCLDIEPCGRFSGKVAWVRGAEAGLTFTCDPAEVAEALIGLAMYG